MGISIKETPSLLNGEIVESVQAVAMLTVNFGICLYRIPLENGCCLFNPPQMTFLRNVYCSASQTLSSLGGTSPDQTSGYFPVDSVKGHTFIYL